MDLDNFNPRLLGAFFFIVAVTSLLSMFLFDSIIGTGSISDNMINISNNLMQIRISILIDIICTIAIVFLGVFLYKALKKQNKHIALVALGLYIVESALLGVSKISHNSLFNISQEFVKAGAPDSSYFQTIATLFLSDAKFAYSIHLLVFGLGALMFYYLFLKSKYVPLVFPAWGIIAASLLVIGTIIVLLFDVTIIVLFVPNMLFELAIGVWLMVIGFSPHAIKSKSD